MTKTPIYKQLTYKKKFNSYTEFYSENREEIFKSIVNLFDEFKNVNSKLLMISISANIENIPWTTELSFKREEVIILKKEVMPFFEKIEDYETCSQIKNILNS